MRLIFIVVAAACLTQENTAARLVEAGHWKRARALVERRLHEAPDDPNAIFLSSQIRNAFGDHSSPLGLAEKAVRLDCGVARYHRQLGEVLGMLAQHAGIFQQLNLARRFRKEIDVELRLDARDVQALRDLLEFCLLAPGFLGGDSKQAGMVANRVAKIDAAEGFLAQARIAESGNDRADSTAETLGRNSLAIDSAPSRAERYLRRYLAQEAEGNQPTAADAHWKLGLAFRAQRLEESAIREWRSAAQLDPESPAARELRRTRIAKAEAASNGARTGGEK